MSGIAAFGTILSMGAPLVPIAGVTNIGGPNLGAETLDVTSHDSAGRYRETIPSFLTAGEVQVDLNFMPATEATHKDAAGGLLNLYNSSMLEDFEIEFPDGTTAAFEAYVTAFSPGAPFDDKLTASVTLTVSGPVTWTYPAP